MYPILARYGPFFLYSYSLMMGLGVLTGVSLAAYQSRDSGDPDFLDGILISLFSGLIGGRGGFVWLHWDYFQLNLSEAWRIWLGGISYHGALLVGLLVLWLWCTWRKRPFTRVIGLLGPGFALASIFGWLACWFGGCAFGKIAALGPFTADLPDPFGVYAVRYQTQMLGVASCLLTFLLLMWLRPRWPALHLFLLALFTISLGRAIISLFRGDPALFWGQIRVDTLADGILALVSLILLQYVRKWQPHSG